MPPEITREVELALFDGYCYALSALATDAPSVLGNLGPGNFPDEEWASWPHVVQYAGLAGVVSPKDAWAALSSIRGGAETSLFNCQEEAHPRAQQDAEQQGTSKAQRAQQSKGKRPATRTSKASAAADPEDPIEDSQDDGASAEAVPPEAQVLTEQPEFRIIGKRVVSRPKGRQVVEYKVSFIAYPGEDEWFKESKVAAAETGRRAIADFEQAASERYSAWVNDQLRDMDAAQPKTQEDTQQEEEVHEQMEIAATQVTDGEAIFADAVPKSPAAAALAAGLAAASAAAGDGGYQQETQKSSLERLPSPAKRTPVTRSRVRAAGQQANSGQERTAASRASKRKQPEENRAATKLAKGPRGGLTPLPPRSNAAEEEAHIPQTQVEPLESAPVSTSPEVGAPLSAAAGNKHVPAQPQDPPADLDTAQQRPASTVYEDPEDRGLEGRFAPEIWGGAQVTKMKGYKDSKEDVKFKVEWNDGFTCDVTYGQIKDHPECAYKLLGFVLNSISFMKTKAAAKAKGGQA